MSEFKISGKLRRERKKELASLKFSLKHFWFFEDNVMGGGLDDVTCQKLISDLQNKVIKLENELKEPSTSILREDKLNRLGL